jgi:Transposase IS200 like
MGVPRGGNAHFKESVYELHKRESHGFSPSVSHRLDHEVSLQGAGRRVAGADTNDYPAAVQRTWRPDRLRRFVARTCPYVRGNPAAYCRQRLRAARQGTLMHQVQMEFPDLRKRYWGRHFWARGYFSTTSGNITDDVILQ